MVHWLNSVTVGNHINAYEDIDKRADRHVRLCIDGTGDGDHCADPSAGSGDRHWYRLPDRPALIDLAGYSCTASDLFTVAIVFPPGGRLRSDCSGLSHRRELE